MAVYLPLSSTLSTRRHLGTDPVSGKILTATVTLSRIAPSSDADSLFSVAEKLDACLNGTNIAYERKTIDSLEE